MVNCEPLAKLRDVDGFLVGGAAVRLVHSGSPPGVFSEFAAIAAAACAAHHAAFHAGQPYHPVQPAVVKRGRQEAVGLVPCQGEQAH